MKPSSYNIVFNKRISVIVIIRAETFEDTVLSNVELCQM